MKDTERNPNDFETTIFIGNLPFIVNEEDLRAHILKEFKDHDPILNIRLIRDPQTFIGKGIGYIQFKDKESMRHVIDNCTNTFMGRELRIKKAVEPRRLDKKQKQRDANKIKHEELRKQQKAEKMEALEAGQKEDAEIDKLRNFEQNAYANSDDDDEPRKPS